MEKLEKYEQHRDLRLAMIVGELLTVSGAEIRRVETTMERIIKTEVGNDADCNCTPGSISATVTYSSGHSKTMILRIGDRNTDFKKIIRLNELSRKYTQHEMTFDEAVEEIETIKNMRVPPLYLRAMLNGLSCAAFTFLMSPTLSSVIASLIIGIFAMSFYETLFSKFELSSFMQTIIASIIITVMAYYLASVGIGTAINYVLIGSITPLLPGVETINAIRDLVESDYLSAISRMLNAVLMGSGIAVGVGFVYLLFNYIGG